MSEPPFPSARWRLLFAKYGSILATPFYFGFSAHVLAPNLFSKFLSSGIRFPLTNTLWFGSHIGISIYLYTTKHLRNAQTFQRLLYTIYGSAIFNFGTVLAMSVVRSIFPDNEALCLGLGLSTSAALLFIGRQYVNYVDGIFDAVRFRAIPRS